MAVDRKRQNNFERRKIPQGLPARGLELTTDREGRKDSVVARVAGRSSIFDPQSQPLTPLLPAAPFALVEHGARQALDLVVDGLKLGLVQGTLGAMAIHLGEQGIVVGAVSQVLVFVFPLAPGHVRLARGQGIEVLAEPAETLLNSFPVGAEFLTFANDGLAGGLEFAVPLVAQSPQSLFEDRGIISLPLQGEPAFLDGDRALGERPPLLFERLAALQPVLAKIGNFRARCSQAASRFWACSSSWTRRCCQRLRIWATAAS